MTKDKFNVAGSYDGSVSFIDSIVVNGQPLKLKSNINIYNGGLKYSTLKHEFIHHLFYIKKTRIVVNTNYRDIMYSGKLPYWLFSLLNSFSKEGIFETKALMNPILIILGYNPMHRPEEMRVRQLVHKDWDYIKKWFNSKGLYT